jgi:hypothetical protein
MFTELFICLDGQKEMIQKCSFVAILVNNPGAHLSVGETWVPSSEE